MPANLGTVIRTARMAGACRDVSMLLVGLVCMFGRTPESLMSLGLDHAVAAVWASSFIIGSLTALYGVFAHQVVVEAVGCFTIGGGFAVWASAIVCRPDATSVSWAIALVLLAGIFGQVYRGVVVASGLTLTEGSR